MCGRYSATKNPAALAEEFEAVDGLDGAEPAAAQPAEGPAPDYPAPDYNVAPTKKVVTVVQRHPRGDDGEPAEDEPAVRSLRRMRWGLVPFWAKDVSVGSRMINTRAETAAEKPAFRKALARRRCLLPADGWFEWQRTASEGGKTAKQPYFMTPPGSESLAFAGIWDTWRDPNAPEGAPPLVSCSILTTEAVGQLVDIHHRMPLLMSRERWAAWLDPDAQDVGELLAPPSVEVADALELRPVSTRVNSVRNNGPELLERVDPASEQALFDAGERLPRP